MNSNPEPNLTATTGPAKVSVWQKLRRSFVADWQELVQPQNRARLIAFLCVGLLGIALLGVVVWFLTHAGQRPSTSAVTNAGVGGLLFLALWPPVTLRSLLFGKMAVTLAWAGVLVWGLLWIGFGLVLIHLPQPVDPNLRVIFCKGGPIATVVFGVIWSVVCFYFKDARPVNQTINHLP